MSATITYKKPKHKPTKSKSARISRGTDLRNCGAIIFDGYIDDRIPKKFCFNIVSHTQQMRERNNAYSFFSID